MATAISRFTSSAAGICWRPSCARPTSPADIDGSAGAIEEVARIVVQIRQRWPTARFLLRADSGLARDNLMAWCENNGVDYLFGLARNARLVAEIEADLAEAAALSQSSGKPWAFSPRARPVGRRFKDFIWRTRDSWSRERRVVAKAEWTGGEANPRFVVTSLTREEHNGQHLYEPAPLREGLLRPRRDGNRIKSLPRRRPGSANSICLPTAPLFRPGAGSRPRRCAPTSCGCGSPRWPMS